MNWRMLVEDGFGSSEPLTRTANMLLAESLERFLEPVEPQKALRE